MYIYPKNTYPSWAQSKFKAAVEPFWVQSWALLKVYMITFFSVQTSLLCQCLWHWSIVEYSRVWTLWIVFIYLFMKKKACWPVTVWKPHGPHHLALHGPSSNLITISLKLAIFIYYVPLSACFSKWILRCLAKINVILWPQNTYTWEQQA